MGSDTVKIYYRNPCTHLKKLYTVKINYYTVKNLCTLENQVHCKNSFTIWKPTKYCKKIVGYKENTFILLKTFTFQYLYTDTFILAINFILSYLIWAELTFTFLVCTPPPPVHKLYWQTYGMGQYSWPSSAIYNYLSSNFAWGPL